jgi:hypothetical protein
MVDDMNALRLGRNRLEHWVHMPFLKDTIKGIQKKATTMIQM